MEEIKLYAGKDKDGNNVLLPFKSTLITGSAGFGKSTLLKEIISHLVCDYFDQDIAVNLFLSKPTDIWCGEDKDVQLAHVRSMGFSTEIALDEFLENIRFKHNEFNVCIIDLDDAKLTKNDLYNLKSLSDDVVFVITTRAQYVNTELLKLFDNLIISQCERDESLNILKTSAASSINTPGKFVCHSFKKDFENIATNIQYIDDSIYKIFTLAMLNKYRTIVNALSSSSSSEVKQAKDCLVEMLKNKCAIHCVGGRECDVVQKALMELNMLYAMYDSEGSDIYIMCYKPGLATIRVETVSAQFEVIHAGTHVLI